MKVQETIERKLSEAFVPAYLDVVNESHMHHVPPGSETHFKVVIVSDAFEGKRLVQRHQLINTILAGELGGGVHALSMQTHTPGEWEKRGGQILASPQCLGGDQRKAV